MRKVEEDPKAQDDHFELTMSAFRFGWAAILQPCISEEARQTPDLGLAEARSGRPPLSSPQRAADLRRVWEETGPLWRMLTQMAFACTHAIQ